MLYVLVLAHLLLHFIVHSKDWVGRIDFMEGVDLLHCVLKLVHRVDLEPQHISTGLGRGSRDYSDMITWSCRKKEDKLMIRMEIFTCWELSITSAKPNFESRIRMDRFGERRTRYP